MKEMSYQDRVLVYLYWNEGKYKNTGEIMRIFLDKYILHADRYLRYLQADGLAVSNKTMGKSKEWKITQEGKEYAEKNHLITIADLARNFLQGWIK